MLSAPPVRWLTAQEATARLKVSRQTLYSYVGRHHVAVTAAPDDPRRSLYDAADVHRLAERDRMGRSRRAIAASTIRYGEPILASAITRIEDGSFSYRGQDAIALAASATLEDVAALLWQQDSLPQSHSKAVWPRASGATGAAGNCIAALAELAMAGRWAGITKNILPDAIRILDQVAWAAAGLPGSVVRRSGVPMHTRLAAAWGRGPKAADLIRRALVLVADHELNAATYAARVVASTGAPVGACVLAGLGALAGPRHGGATDEIRALLADPAVIADPESAVTARWARDERVPGFGHALYPHGDPRAVALLSRLPPRGHAHRLIETTQRMAGVAPRIEFALVLLERQLRLPPGAAFALFATGRTVGWIAHVMEQWQAGTLIRPRALPGAYAV
jgi:citrate synthase